MGAGPASAVGPQGEATPTPSAASTPPTVKSQAGTPPTVINSSVYQARWKGVSSGAAFSSWSPVISGGCWKYWVSVVR